MNTLRTLSAAGTLLVIAALLGHAVLAQAGEAKGENAFVGSKSCKKCHSAVHKSWSKTPHGNAFETLKPNEVTDVKAKFNLDPTKDYTTDSKCLKCHVVGFGQEGGYATPDPEDKKAVRKAKSLAGVGCENCHGPGSAYSKLHKEIQKSKRTYTVEEMYAAGMRKIDETICTGCHNDQGPTHDPSKTFDFETMKEKGVHEHGELKQREG